MGGGRGRSFSQISLLIPALCSAPPVAALRPPTRDRALLPGNPGDSEGSEVGELGKRVGKRDFVTSLQLPLLTPHVAPQRRLFGLETLRGEFSRGFLFSLCEKKKGGKKAAQ